MVELNKRWQVATPISSEAEQNLKNYAPVLRQILYNRGYTSADTANRFLKAQIPPGTGSFDLLGVPQAVDRIEWAIKHKELIAIYGDYDADGVTSTALLTHVLRVLGAQVQGYIPNRFDEGYGLNNEALEYLYNGGTRLVITVDCGIRSIEEAGTARKLGLDLIISDHHHPANEIPNATAVINPKQKGDSYPEKDLAGVGLAYKLAAALIEKQEPQAVSADDYLDLVALGTVSDLAPLVGENRYLVRSGLERIRMPYRQGLMALIGAAGLNVRRISAADIGFGIGPRLNAAGRLDSALAALNLLLTEDVFEAGKLAQQLEIQNRERQQITKEIQAQAEEMALAKDPQALLLIAAHPDFNPGVVGLAASRLTEKYYRPAIVAQIGETHTRGSCRSIPEFHITQALDENAHLLEHHGGHAAAAGFTIRNELFPELATRLQSIAADQLSSLDLRPTLIADIELPLSDLHPEILKYLEWLQPTGIGNPQATFVSRHLRIKSSRTVGRDNAHLKLAVTDGRITYDAIAFRQGHWYQQLPVYVDLLYTFELNEYNGRTSLQLNVRDIKPSGFPD
jgi:single-stranded-DNA-specific exonuclease